MPTEIKRLFRLEAVRPRLGLIAIPGAGSPARAKLDQWAHLLASREVESKKETELLPGFIHDIFEGLLGYVGAPAEPYTLKREALVKVDGKFADAALGRFQADRSAFIAALEGKGPRDPLDRPFAGRKRSAVEQALQYAVQLRIDWYLVTNLRETRLYHKGNDTFTYERFRIEELAADELELRRFLYLLGAERVLAPTGNHLDALLAESRKIGRELTNAYYAEYRKLRETSFDALRRANPSQAPAKLLAATQKILDRVLFIAFCEDRGLLPREIIQRAYQHADPFNPRPVWQNFLGLFRAVDQGNEALRVWKYNGGLFADDPFLESLNVPDSVCRGFKTLADYEYGNSPASDGKLIDVEILGHIFEQSISDLEELQSATTETVKNGPSKRKKEGAFYTPEFVTRYIVAETLGPVLREKFEAYRAERESAAAKNVRKALVEPAAFDPDQLTKPQQAALVAFWNGWLRVLESVHIVDPACGSGAFLMEAFNQMYAAYETAQGYLTTLQGTTLLDIRRTILIENLFGMDLNAEAVEIARLSCWIKTAEVGKELTTLDANIQQGNSVIVDPAPREGWRRRFPNVFAAGGFDVVIGNPPYVRQEWIKADKPYLETNYKAFDGVADLYVYFYELGLNILKPGGRLGFIVTNKWMRAGYGEALRRLYSESAWVEQVVDFGHAKQIFPDADVFPSILITRKPIDSQPAPSEAKVCAIPREQLRIDDLSRQINGEGVPIPRSRLSAAPWNLEPPGVVALMEKIRAKGVLLKEFAGVSALYGIKTAFNDAYLIDGVKKNQLVNADPNSESLFKPYLRGQDIDRWQAEWSGSWMIAMKSGANHPWPWSGKSDIDAESLFRQTHPALFNHFEQYRTELTRRQDQGEFWWELRSCAFWNIFDLPKIWFQQIQFHSCYAYDSRGLLGNNKTTFLPVDAPFVLGVLNSPLLWWHNYRFLPHMKDEALATVVYMMDQLPIPTPTDPQRSATETAVRRLIDITAERQAGRRAVLDWLKVEYDIEKPSQKLQAVAALDADGFIAEVRKLRGKKQPLSVAGVKGLKDEHLAGIVPLQALGREADQLERRVSDLVNEAFGLTPEEIALMWRTAPPRMPLSPPTS